MLTVVPALIPKNRSDIVDFAASISFTAEVHIDVVDGEFVPYTSWPYQSGEEPRDVKFTLDRFSLEVDLMVRDPLTAATAWVRAGADSLVFHVETISLASFITIRETLPVSIGICASKSTPFSVLETYLPYADYVQVMGIAEIGAQGQPFDDYCFERIADIRRVAPHLDISVDGSVNRDTITALYRHNIRRCIVGSAIVQAANPAQAYSDLVASALQQE
jgi:pentose-5-phosphate-3-epimerase